MFYPLIWCRIRLAVSSRLSFFSIARISCFMGCVVLHNLLTNLLKGTVPRREKKRLRSGWATTEWVMAELFFKAISRSIGSEWHKACTLLKRIFPFFEWIMRRDVPLLSCIEGSMVSIPQKSARVISLLRSFCLNRQLLQLCRSDIFLRKARINGSRALSIIFIELSVNLIDKQKSSQPFFLSRKFIFSIVFGGCFCVL